MAKDTIGALFFGIFLSFVSLQIWHNYKSSKRAIKALKQGEIKEKKVAITIDTFDEFPSYYAKVYIKENLYWDCSFDNFGWTPKEGCFDAKLYFLKKYPFPLLVVLENGIFYPKVNPRKSTSKTKLGHLRFDVMEC